VSFRLTIITGLLLGAPSWAEERVETGFIARSNTAIDMAHDRDPEDLVETWTTWTGRAKGTSDTGRWYLSVTAEHQFLVGLCAYGGDVEGAWDFRPGESGIEKRVGPVHLRGGYLIERWGKLDMLSMVDVLNPRDMRAGPLGSLDDLRVPVPMGRLQTDLGPLRAELVATPIAPGTRSSLVGTDWSLLRQGMLSDFVEEASGWRGDGFTDALFQDALGALADGLRDTEPAFRRGMSDAISQVSDSQPRIADGQLAVRLEAAAPGVDGALMGGWLVSPTPAPALDPILTTMLQEERLPGLADQGNLLSLASSPISAERPRTWMTGAEVGTTVGVLGVRAEGAWFSARPIPQQWMGSENSPVVGGGLGIDWAHGSTVFIMAETRWEHLMTPPTAPLLTSTDQVQSALSLQFSVLQSKLSLTNLALYNWSFQEFMLRPQATWRARDQVELSVGALILDGPVDAVASLQDAMTYTGGPLSYWSDNDSFTVGAAWIW